MLFLIILLLQMAALVITCCKKKPSEVNKEKQPANAIHAAASKPPASPSVSNPSAPGRKVVQSVASQDTNVGKTDAKSSKKGRTHTEALGDDMTYEVNTVDPHEGAKQPRRLTDSEFQRKAQQYMEALRQKEEREGADEDEIEGSIDVAKEGAPKPTTEEVNKTQRSAEKVKPNDSPKPFASPKKPHSLRKPHLSEKTCTGSEKKELASQKTARAMLDNQTKTAKSARERAIAKPQTQQESSEKTAVLKEGKQQDSQRKTPSHRNRKSPSKYADKSCEQSTLKDKTEDTQKKSG